ncbi:MAG: hypothetical protein JSS81_28630 [Acidobacteria bacterium]|nr:hypothetical protein [Acidobacteriota bacterium]
MADDADGKGELKRRYIARIEFLQGELARRGVMRETFDYESLDLAEICELGIAVADQLKRRKKFLGEKNQ